MKMSSISTALICLLQSPDDTTKKVCPGHGMFITSISALADTPQPQGSRETTGT